jgi:hypothetical protein
MGKVRAALEQTQEENVRFLLENETLKEENAALTSLLQEEIDSARNHEHWFVNL